MTTRSTRDRQTVLITGCSGGIGAAVTRRFSADGWRVLGIDRNQKRLAALREELDDCGHLFEEIDLREDRLSQVVSDLFKKAGRLDGVVNLAGVSVGDEIGRLSDSDWESSMKVNATVPMELSRLAIPHLEKTTGSILNVGSPVGLIGARKPSYAASKAALHGLTMSLARNLGPRGIRVNLLLPGTCLTPLTADWSREKQKRVAEGTFLKRLCRPEEVASVVYFLIGKEASYLTGSVVDMTAGGIWGH